MANLLYPRTKIDEHEHLIQPLRVHSLLSDFELEDVWWVPVNLASTHSLQLFMDQLAKTNATLVNRGMTGLLFRIRFFMGRLLKWDEKLLQNHLIPGSIRFRYAQQENLTYDDLPHPGSGSFIPVYKLENEFLSEIENSTVQGALHLSRVPSVEREANRTEMKLAERDKQLNDLRKQLEEARRKAEQGSMQTQGEVQEIALEQLLTDLFKFDSIQEVPKGQNGADTIHLVRSQYGKECGIIVYESKRTKNFSEGWITKLKEDMREHGANHGILVTEVMPKDMPTFGLRSGIWICTFKEVAGLAGAIRQICITEANIKATEFNRAEKIQALYNYLMSNEFKQRVEAIIETSAEMRQIIDKQRKSMLASWSKLNNSVDQMRFLVSDIVGSIDGISGNALGPVRGLVLEEGSEAA